MGMNTRESPMKIKEWVRKKKGLELTETNEIQPLVKKKKKQKKKKRTGGVRQWANETKAAG